MFRRCFTISALGIGILLYCALLFGGTASAHPLGNYSINHYTIFELRGGEFRIFHMLDFAEIPSFREMDLLDVDFNSAISESEIETYLEVRVPEFLSNLAFTRNGNPLALKLLSQRLEVYEGTGAMPVFKVFLELAPSEWVWPAPGQTMTLDFRSKNHPTARGYRESYVLLDGRYGIDVGPWTEPELKYLIVVEKDENQNPIFQSFHNRFLLDLSPGTAQASLGALPDPPDFSWTATARAEEEEEVVLIAKGGRTFDPSEAPLTKAKPVITGPSSSDDEAKSAPPAPPSKVTVVQPTRTPESAHSEASEHLIGRVSDIISTQELTMPMVLFALAIAFALGMGHAFSPGHGKTVVAAYLIGERGTVRHAVILGIIVTITHVWSVLLLGIVTLYAGERFTEEEVAFWTGVASGLIIVLIGVWLFFHRYAAYQTAREAQRHFHPHDHGHERPLEHDLSHHHAHDHDHSHAHENDDHTHAHEHDHAHSHGLLGKPHSHVIKTPEGKPPTYSSIMWLGISGGIVPCPAALIVLLLAIKFGRLQLGLLLILSFSIGLAAVLVAIGIAVVKASGRIRKAIGEQSPILLALPVASSVLITVLGLWVVLWTLLQFNVIALPAIS